MEKLIELLNEWYIERYGTNPHFVRFEDCGGNDYGYFVGDDKLMVETEVWTKKYGFIKRLVDNDKIDRDKVKRESKKLFVGDLEPRTPRYKLLILLSISNNPIEDLISYLK